jgi:hypothetical protein
LILGGVAVAGNLVWRVASNPGKAGAAAATGAAKAAVGGLGSLVGLPTPDDTETDPAVARYIIDQLGYISASAWCGAGALFSGAMMASGSGVPPAQGRPVWAALNGADAQTGPLNAAPPSTAAAMDKYTQGGNAATGSGSIDTFTDPMTGFGSQWGT